MRSDGISRRQALTGSVATAVSLSSLIAQGPPAQVRKVAITIDDGPAVGAGNDLAAYQRIQAGIVSCFKAEQVPVIMFVNERQLNVDGQRDARVQILHNWLDAGFDLGNHMYSHPQLAQMQLWQFEDDLIKGEVLMRPILEARGKKLVWFRHPYLNTGSGPEFFREFHEFLAKRGYRVAPVTVDYKDYSYAGVWSRLMRDGKKADADRVYKALVEAVDKGFEYFEKESREVLGYEVAQTLLIHCNELESVSLRDSIAVMRKRGYTFVTMEEAMRDPAYGRPDVYLGPGGTGWIRRWSTMMGRPPSGGAPQMPAWISELAPPRAGGRGGPGRGGQPPIPR